jgi:hypothetical protein
MDILADTLGDIKVWMLNSHKRYGIWGVTPFSWFFSYLSGRLFKLGRLQFAPAPFWGSVIAFRNISTREVVAFSEPDICYRKDGLINGTNSIYETENTFVSKYEVNDHDIKGNLVLPAGTVQREITVLERSVWQEVLRNGDMLLGVHIPEGGKMDYDRCGASFNSAIEFFNGVFPETSYKGFSCGSWLLDPQLRLLLPESSNIVRFQKEFYLFPVQCSDEAVIDRVFGCERKDFENAPAVTALQRSIKDFMNAGGKLHSAGMFLLTEDLKWGSQVYQSPRA